MGKDLTESGGPVLEGGRRVNDADMPSSSAAQNDEALRRRLRAAEKLRENLARRKQQVRARRAGQADETNGLPAAKMDESS